MMIRAAITAVLIFTAYACAFACYRESCRDYREASGFVIVSQLGVALAAVGGIFAMVLQ